MGFSTGRDLHIDQVLTNVAINFRPQGMIADLVAPVVPVAKEHDIYHVFNQAEAYRIEDSLRARGTEARKITVSVSSRGYTVKNYALGRDLYIEDIANMDAALQAQMGLGATFQILDNLRLGWEQRLFNTVNSASNVSTVFLPASSWVGGGDPISQIEQMREEMMGRTGYWPNSILFGWRAWTNFRRNVNVRNTINGVNNGKGFVTRQQAQDLFETERFLVQGAHFNTANEAVSSVNLTNPFHDRVLLYYAPPAPTRETPSFMYTFRWQAPQLPAPMVVERHPYDSRRKIETIEAGMYQTEEVTGIPFGALLAGVSSSQANGIA